MCSSDLIQNFRPALDAVELTVTDGTIKAAKKYFNPDFVSGVASPVLVGDHVYGYSESSRKSGWACLEARSGKAAWDGVNDLGGGSLCVADGHLYCFTDDEGVVALVEANPAKWVEKSRFQIPQQSKLRKPSGKLWTPPVVANGRLYLRDQDLLFCYNVKK